jgi:hypothetical protein
MATLLAVVFENQLPRRVIDGKVALIGRDTEGAHKATLWRDRRLLSSLFWQPFLWRDTKRALSLRSTSLHVAELFAMPFVVHLSRNPLRSSPDRHQFIHHRDRLRFTRDRSRHQSISGAVSARRK